MPDLGLTAGEEAPLAFSGQPSVDSILPIVPEANSLLFAGMGLTYERHLQHHVECDLLLTRREFSVALAVNENELDAALSDEHSIAVAIGSGETFYPKFLTQPGLYPADALKRVIKTLGGISDGEKYHFLTASSHSLGGQSPIERLATGDLCAVLTAASAFAAP